MAGVALLEALHEAAGEEARPAGALKRPFIPAVFTLLVHEDDVSLLQLDLGFTLRRVRDEHTVPDRDTREHQTITRQTFKPEP